MGRLFFAVITTSTLYVGSFAQMGGPAGQAQPSFHSRVDLVELDVVVLNNNRRPVLGLTSDDFTVLEDGKTRRIDVFVPMTLQDATAAFPAANWVEEAAPDVVTNRYPEGGRLVVIMMDRSIRAGPQTVTARAIATAAIDALGPNDLAAVVRNSGIAGEGVSQNFTADRARLRAAVAAPFMGLTAPPEMTLGGLAETQPRVTGVGHCPCGVCALESIAHVADALATVKRRQKLVLFIGSDIVIYESPRECEGAVKIGRETAFRALDRANVTFHALDPTGLESLAKSAGTFGRGTGPSAAANLRRQASLAVLPDYTGGRTVLNTNAPDSVVPQIYAETGSYYLLAFEPSEVKHSDERRREIRVKVNRKGLSVRARRGYYVSAQPVAKSASSGDARSAVAELLPKADLPLRVGLAPTFQSDGTAGISILLEVDRALDVHSSAGPPRVAAHAERVSRRFDVVIGVFDMHARSIATLRRIIEVTEDASRRGEPHSETLTRVPVKPGSYEVRVGVAEIESTRSGSVYGYVDIPEPGVLSMSALLERTISDAAPRSAEMPARVFGVATLQRTFSPADRVVAVVRVRRARNTQAPVAVRTQLIDERYRAVTQATQMLDSSSFDMAGRAEYRFDLPLSSLEPGPHLLRMEAFDGRASQRRDVPFAIR